MQRPRAADDFAAIRARMEELRREREPAVTSGREVVAPRSYAVSASPQTLGRLKLPQSILRRMRARY